MAPQGGGPPSAPHRPPSAPVRPGTLTLVQRTGPERDPGAILSVPDLWTWGHVTRCLVLAHCPPAARTDLPALPRRHVPPQLLLQQPGAPRSLQRRQGVSWLCRRCCRDTGVPVPYRAGEVGEGRAGAPLQGTQRSIPLMFQQQEVIGAARQHSWGCARGLGGAARGGQGGLTPQPDPWAAPALPPQQYSRSRKHWVSRTCPLLHTCPRDRISSAWGCPWGSCRAAVGQRGVLPAHRG